MTDRQTAEIRAAVAGADRGFTVYDGGKGREPPAETRRDGCPITALGHVDGKFHFLDVVGQRRELSARALGSRHDLLSLFLGQDGWLRDQYPKKSRVKRQDEGGGETEVEVTIDFNINRASAALQVMCKSAGMFGEHVVLRKPGVWAPVAGIPAVHCGDEVLLEGDWHPAGSRSGNVVWAAAPPMARPTTPCAAEVGKQLQADLQALFNFAEPGAAVVVLGLLGTAYLGAAAQWRSAGYLIGPGGCGKSTLLKVMVAASPMHWFSNDATKAGLEQGLNGRAMPCYIDETEKSGDARGAQALLDLVLTASGSEGTQGARGGVDGTGRRIEVVGSIVMAATSPPEMRETHLGRFAIVALRRPEEGEDFRAQHAALIARMGVVGPALWGRAISSFERYQQALVSFREALGDASCAPRERDQMGAILAGWWILTHEGAPDARGAREGVGALAGFVRSAEIVAEESNARRLGQYLLTRAVQLSRSTDRATIAQLVLAVLKNAQWGDGDEGGFGAVTARNVLRTIGLRVIRFDEPKDTKGRPAPRMGVGNGLWLNDRSTELARLFENSDWQAGRWRTGFLELDTAKRSPTNVRVGDVSIKGVWINLHDLGLTDEDDPP